MQKIILIIIFLLIVLLNNLVEVKAQSRLHILSSQNPSVQFITFRIGRFNFQLPSRGRPSRTRSTARRGKCDSLHLDSPLIVLVPQTQESLDRISEDLPSVLGKTSEQYPVFWFYVPELPEGKNLAEFRLQDESGNSVLRERINIELSGQSEVVGFPLPRDEEPLAPGQNYQWIISIICNPGRPSENPSADGWIELIEPSLDFINRLEQASDLEKIKLYAVEGIWHETLTELARQRLIQPYNNALIDDWTNLLINIGIDQVSEREVIEENNIRLLSE